MYQDYKDYSNNLFLQVFLSGLSSEVTLLQMTAAYTKKRSRVILDLTPQFHNGVSEGLLKEVSAKEVSDYVYFLCIQIKKLFIYSHPVKVVN